MGLLNYFYLVYGIGLFLWWRIIHHFTILKRRPYPKPGSSSIIFFLVGSGYILALINMLYNVDLSYGMDNLIIIPTILFILAILNFCGESFIAPSKNYLIALGVGILVGTGVMFLLRMVFIGHGSYLEILPVFLALPIGAITGLLFHAFILKRRYPDWSTPLWEVPKLWEKMNHIAFLLVFFLICFIEATLQLRSDSLFYLFTSF